MHFLADPSTPLKSVSKDRFLFTGAKFYRDRKKVDKQYTYYKSKFPYITPAFEIYTHNRMDGWRWFIEALLMTPLTDAEIVDALKIKCSPEVIKAYRKLFFDIDAFRESPAAVTANILSTSRAAAMDFNNCDYTWKIFAYTWGAEAFLDQFSCNKQKINKKYKTWFKDLTNDRLTVHSFQITSDLRLMYNNQAMDVLRLAREYWTIPSESMEKGENIAKQDFVDSILGHVDMCLMSASEKLGSVEARPNFNYALLDK